MWSGRGRRKRMNKDVIRFTAQVSKVQTLADGGIRLTFDISEKDIDTATKIMQAKQAGAALEVAAIPVKVIKSKKKSDEFDMGI